MALKKPVGLYGGELEGFATGDAVDILFGGTGANTAAGARTSLGLAIGTDVQAFSNELASIAGLTTTGIITRTAAGTYVPRTLTGTAGRISATNGDGVAGAPSFDLVTVADAGGGAFLKLARDVYGRVTGTSAPVAADIGSIVDTRYVRLDASTALNTGVVISYNAGTTTFNPNDLVPRSYVDLIAQGYSGNFAEVRLSTTGANIVLAGSAPSTLDGVTLVAGDSILVKDQTTGSQNGWYAVSTVGTGANGTWTRMAGYDTSAEVFPGIYTFVSEGTVNGNASYALTTDAPITLNTTFLVFTQTSGAGQIIAQNGISKSGNVLSGVSANSTRIAVSGAGFDLAALTIGGNGVGTFTKYTVDTYGRITATANATPADIGAQPSSAELSGVATLTTTGMVARTGVGTYTTRTLVAPVAGISITNADGIAGNPTFALSNDLAALEALNGSGFYTRVGADTWAARSITGTSGRVTVVNGDGVAGAPTIDLTAGVIASPGTYASVTVDTYGRVIAGSAPTNPVATTQVITNSNGAVINIGQVIYTDAAGGKLAKSDADLTRRVIGFVADTTIANTGAGNIATAGSIVATTAQWDAVTGNTGGLVANTTYYLSAATAGSITSVPPTAGWVQPVGTASSSTSMRIGVQGRSVKI